ncbi:MULTISPECIES: sulfite exporter TauE/SafE family protein [unclassified Paludibacterium]|uniref:sulfite exporter TauE/SafE family protein n=1 Tax=unclassified Paludibacterium TaxID=2618429 RepID=UPI001C04BBB9|nr:sulfite exporter TauE/SafE family protein [Paludibacterium sp. B53371]BEV71873.1 sulfite exporter TauE/SafE family protein [Paludibacterium sp. THUN1379]
MTSTVEWGVLLAIGLAAGVSSGVFGIGGGILIVPALVFLLKFPMPRAIGTSLAVLLPPVGAAAVWSYYRASMVDLRAAAVLALMLFIGAWFGAQLVQRMDGTLLKAVFGLFLIAIGLYTIYTARGA